METSTCIWQREVSLAAFSTYKIGGKAKLFTKVQSVQQLSDAVKYCNEHQIRFYILGKGSNTLFDDRGFEGAVILNALRGVQQKGDVFEVLSGTSFAHLAAQTAKLGYGGLEYGCGIPGSVGGAVFMNAGAHGQEIAPLVESVDYLDQKGELKTRPREELQFAYRSSCFQSMSGIITTVELKLYKDQNARKRQLELIQKRSLSQPLQQSSCGCVFRNGSNYSVGQLIDQLGMKGFEVGGAQISPVHANFIVNRGEAKADDVRALVEKIEKEVYAKTGHRLEREIRFVPFLEETKDAL